MIFNVDSNSKEIKELKNDVAENAGRAAVNEHTLGYTVKNILKVEAVSKTLYGVKFTVNDDGSVTLNGTATGNTSLVICSELKLKKGETYIISKGISSNTPIVTSTSVYKDREKSDEFSTALNRSVFTVSEDFDSLKLIRIYVRTGETYNNVKVYPMIRHASILDDTFEPYRESVQGMLTNENNETFNFGVKNGVRGFFTDPSRADDSFIPFSVFDFAITIACDSYMKDLDTGDNYCGNNCNFTFYIINGVPEIPSFMNNERTGSIVLLNIEVRYFLSCTIKKIATIDKNKNEIAVLYEG